MARDRRWASERSFHAAAARPAPGRCQSGRGGRLGWRFPGGAGLRLPGRAFPPRPPLEPADHDWRAGAHAGRRVASRRMNPDAFIGAAFAPAEEAVRAGQIPGAVLGIVTADGGRAVHFAGSAQIEPFVEPLSPETWFDLASLTKVIFTSSRILRLVDDGH